MHKVFKGQFLKTKVMFAAMAYSMEKYLSEMEDIKNEDVKAWEWLIDKEPRHWARACFRTTPKCDIVLNNLCECFNGTRALLMARQKPILSMLERIRMYLLQRFTKQRVAADKWHGDIGPRISKILEKNKLLSAQNMAHYCGNEQWQVQNMYGSMYAVDLRHGTCSCKRWDLSGIVPYASNNFFLWFLIDS